MRWILALLKQADSLFNLTKLLFAYTYGGSRATFKDYGISSSYESHVS